MSPSQPEGDAVTLDEAIEKLRERRVDSSVARLLNTVDDVIAVYDAERAEKALPIGTSAGSRNTFDAKAKQCEPWCGSSSRRKDYWCSLECSDAEHPINPKVTP
jgi:hypothetical protein